MAKTEKEVSTRSRKSGKHVVPVPRAEEPAAPDAVPEGAARAADDVTLKHSVTFTVPVIGKVWLGEPKHLPFYAGIAALGALEIIEWPVVVVIAIGKLLAENAHRELLRDFGKALEEEG